MRHIKPYNSLNESLEWNKQDWEEIRKDQQINDWLNSAKLDDDWFDPEGDNEIITPYGEKITLNFWNQGEYTGEGDWRFTAESDADRFGIIYNCDGRGRGKSYTYPEETIFDDDVYASIFHKDFDPSIFVTGLMEKAPLICVKLYSLCSQRWKEKIIQDMEAKGISTNILKGGSYLNKFL
jgi:hypothetical protein